MNRAVASASMPASRKNRQIPYFWRNAPLAAATAAMPGGVNYAAVLILSFGWGFEETGTFRLIHSCFALLGLLCLSETNKIFVRAVVKKDRETAIALALQRLFFAITAFVIAAFGYGFGTIWAEGVVPINLVFIAALAVIIFPLDLYLAKLQAEKKFGQLFVSEALKYSCALGAFFLAIIGGQSIENAVFVQLCVIATFNLLYAFIYSGQPIQIAHVRGGARSLWSRKTCRQARTYSIAALLPASLEHIDKILVGWIFGLEFLGLYVLAYSTGRFVYNALKPTSYVYYRHFVYRMPAKDLLRKIGAAFTGLGLLCAVVFLIAIETVPRLEKFRDGSIVTAILFLGYGIGMMRAVYGQAFAINPRSSARQMLYASVMASGLAMILLALALASPPASALVLLALQYPARDALTLFLLSRFRRAGA